MDALNTSSTPATLLLNQPPTYGLEKLGMRNLGRVFRNLPVSMLVEQAIAHGEGVLAESGALCVNTGKYTGRSPNDKFIVDEPSSHDNIHWNNLNVPLSETHFEELYHDVLAYVQGRDLYLFDGFVGADPKYRKGVRIITELASQSLFAHQLFLRPSEAELQEHHPDFTVISVPGLTGDPAQEGIHSEAFIVLNFAKRLVLIGGSKYAGEIKKSVFCLMNYFMTQGNVLPMHCSANMDSDGNTALFFGLSGTGKTTLSADPDRRLIGDDEHGWSDHGIFNFEGGCYAKTIHLSQTQEPEIWSAIRFGAIAENLVLESETREADYDDASLTENTRVAFPVTYIPNSVIPGIGNHPTAIFFLSADAFGVLPPLAMLTPEQAMYYFMSGYTSKLAGTERGIIEPQATFSACFGKPFLPLSATIYARMLGDRLAAHQAPVYLINTGWIGGGYGVGERIPINISRALITAALNGSLTRDTVAPCAIFKFLVPTEVAGVPSELLDPRNSWADKQAYDRQARHLAQLFIDNFNRYQNVTPAVLAAGPSLGDSPSA
jgi:phosphoenolpyruvate carboxykinase (ATP)